MDRLVLFDIDGTLTWGGPAKGAFALAMQAVFGTAGRIDGTIVPGRTAVEAYALCGYHLLLLATLLAIAATEEGQEALDTAYQWNALEEHDDTFYDPFRQVLQAAGLDAADLLGE